MNEPWREPNPQPEPPKRTIIQKIVEPGINSPGTTIAGLVPAIYFISGELMTQDLQSANWQQVAMWAAIAAIGWFAKSHNVTSEAAGLK